MLSIGCKEEMEELEESLLFGSYTPFAEDVPVARSPPSKRSRCGLGKCTKNFKSVNCDGVTIRVAMGGSDMSTVATAKGRTKKSPKNIKKAGKIYTINLNTGKPELWGHH